jgi:hypothetical protein
MEVQVINAMTDDGGVDVLSALAELKGTTRCRGKTSYRGGLLVSEIPKLGDMAPRLYE